MAKVILDEGLSRLSVNLLKAEGVDAVHVHDIGLLSAPDSAVMKIALDENRIVFTLDHDLHSMLALSGLRFPSVVFFRFQHLKARETYEKFLSILQNYESDLLAGSALTVSPGRVRLRRLPLKRYESLS